MRTFNLFILLTFIAGSTRLYSQDNQNSIFERSKGKWLLPIPKYHRVIDNNLTIPYGSDGILFLTDSSYLVRAVFDGSVIATYSYEENSYAILVKFGDYFISYSFLTKLRFKKGDYIKSGDIIGTLIKDVDEPSYELDIILQKKTKSMPVYKWFNWQRGT